MNTKTDPRYHAMAESAKEDLSKISSVGGRLWYRMKYGMLTKLTVTALVFFGALAAIFYMITASEKLPENVAIGCFVIVGITLLSGAALLLGFFRKVFVKVPSELW